MSTTRVGILYIATGRYTIFWDEFYRSAERYFMTECEKSYFVFTDRPQDIKHKGNVRFYHQEKLGWPYDTLMRFDTFLKAEEALKGTDYLYFFNANIQFIAPISGAEFISPDRPLLGILHPGFWDKTAADFTYDRNPKCRAYMPYNAGYQYVMGGGNGGSTPRFLELIRDLSLRVRADLDEGIIALWHDESHLNRYCYEYHDEFHILPVSYATPEEWVGGSVIGKLFYASRLRNKGVKVVIRNKANPWYGGHAWLRGEVEEKNLSLRDKLKSWLYRCLVSRR